MHEVLMQVMPTDISSTTGMYKVPMFILQGRGEERERERDGRERERVRERKREKRQRGRKDLPLQPEVSASTHSGFSP